MNKEKKKNLINYNRGEGVVTTGMEKRELVPTINWTQMNGSELGTQTDRQTDMVHDTPKPKEF